MRFQSLWQMPLLLGVAATSFTYAAAPAAVSAAPAAPVAVVAKAAPSGPVDTATLLKQIEDLKKQVSQIAYKQRKAEEKLESTVKVEDAKIGVLQANQVSPYPAGYIAIPGSNSAIKIGGRIKADAAYYPGNTVDGGNLSFDGTRIPVRGSDPQAGKSGGVAGTAAYSRFELKSLTQTNAGDVKGWIQTDFNGSQSSSASTSYGLRLRHALVEWNSLMVGQTTTNFHDSDEGPYTLDNNGFTATARRVQVRWTQKLMDGLSLAVAAERPNTDYLAQDGTTKGNDGFGRSNLPDLTARLRYEGKQGFVSLRGIVRQLAVNVAAGEAVTTSTSSGTGALTASPASNRFASKQTGWGIGSSFKLVTSGLSSLYGQVNTGDGINQFLAVESIPSAYLQVPTVSTTGAAATRYAARFDTHTGSNAILGYEHWWTEKFRTNIAGSYTKVKNSQFAPVSTSATQVTSRLKKVLVNAIYSPVKQIDVGIEFMYGTRETIGGTVDIANTIPGQVSNAPGSNYAGGTGKATQVMTSFIYKF
ncbi:MAG: DcaP family trimeric outer membrane transporter [Pseudomonadota bacterium]